MEKKWVVGLVYMLFLSTSVAEQPLGDVKKLEKVDLNFKPKLAPEKQEIFMKSKDPNKEKYYGKFKKNKSIKNTQDNNHIDSNERYNRYVVRDDKISKDHSMRSTINENPHLIDRKKK